MKPNTETTFIEVSTDLSTDDLIQIGEYLVRMDTLKQELIDRKKASASDFNAKIQEQDSNMKESIRLLRDKVRHEEVLCRWEYDHVDGMVHFFSSETGELVHTRPMNEEERQMEIFSREEKERVLSANDTSEDVNPVYDIPRCHMKEMSVKDEDEFGITYHCLKCKTKKTICKSTGM